MTGKEILDLFLNAAALGSVLSLFIIIPLTIAWVLISTWLIIYRVLTRNWHGDLNEYFEYNVGNDKHVLTTQIDKIRYRGGPVYNTLAARMTGKGTTADELFDIFNLEKQEKEGILKFGKYMDEIVKVAKDFVDEGIQKFSDISLKSIATELFTSHYPEVKEKDRAVEVTGKLLISYLKQYKKGA